MNYKISMVLRVGLFVQTDREKTASQTRGSYLEVINMKNNKTLTVVMSLVLVLSLTDCASTVRPGNRGLMWRPWSSGLDREVIFDDGISLVLAVE